MKREIKFRAWDTKSKAMTVNFDIFSSGIVHSGSGNELIVMQYTGLNDKSGKEIYEEDIVAIKKWISNPPDTEYAEAGIYTIHWSEDNAGFKFYPRLNDIHDVYDPNDENEYIVIGNTYENPELIK